MFVKDDPSNLEDYREAWRVFEERRAYADRGTLAKSLHALLDGFEERERKLNTAASLLADVVRDSITHGNDLDERPARFPINPAALNEIQSFLSTLAPGKLSVI